VVYAQAGSKAKGAAGDDVIYGGSGTETLEAKAGNDVLFGGAGDDTLKGDTGNDLLQGGDGKDDLRGGAGADLLDGGSGNDEIASGKGADVITGGAGSDTIRTGRGTDVILFNRGDGADTVIGDGAADDTLSLGGGIRYSDLSLAKAGKDLIVSAGGDDRIVLRDWYAGRHTLNNLQLILDANKDFDALSQDTLYSHRVQNFDFAGLVGAFDQARAASPGLTSWSLTNALLQFHLSARDDAAIGGDLAYWYGNRGSFTGMSIAAAEQVIGASGFGADAQQLHPFSGLQDGFIKLG
jgi:Ca2+-binding RTX toxin-like protein